MPQKQAGGTMKKIRTQIPTRIEYNDIAQSLGEAIESRDNGDQLTIKTREGLVVELPSRFWWRLREDIKEDPNADSN